MFTDDDEDPDWWWHPGWFPFSLSTWGAKVTLDCTKSAERTPILLVDHREVPDFRQQRARSLGELVSWWIDALGNRGWQYNASTNEWQSDPAGLVTVREDTNLI
jgi:cell wall assembly regulator SMI1